MRPRLSLFTKVLLLLLLNLVVLGAALIVFFSLQFRFEPDSPLFAASRGRLESVARLMDDEMRTAAEAERTTVLRRYSSAYRVDFLLCSNNGRRLAGADIPVPDEVMRRVVEAPPRPGPGPGRGPRSDALPPRPEPDMGGSPPPRGPGSDAPPRGPWPAGNLAPTTPPAQPPYPIFTVKTTSPTRYWAGVRLTNFSPGQREQMHTTLLAVSDSMFGHGLFFDPSPWMLVAGSVLVLSILLWLPFVRGLTVTVKQITAATEQIAEERFVVRVNEKRHDELGRLGAAINQLAVRLAGFVGGQRRFLGDISHELNSPLARMQLALGILEERVDSAHLGYVADAQEEVRLMSQLVEELLAFAKAGMRKAELKLVSVPLLPLVRRIWAREAANCEAKIEIAESAAALAQPELLARALANVLRNAARYAYAGGPITIVCGQIVDLLLRELGVLLCLDDLPTGEDLLVLRQDPHRILIIHLRYSTVDFPALFIKLLTASVDLIVKPVRVERVVLRFQVAGAHHASFRDQPCQLECAGTRCRRRHGNTLQSYNFSFGLNLDLLRPPLQAQDRNGLIFLG
jgi:two-component system sensor histidine kinase CpxA